jgi:hypothetical protein
VRRELLTWPFAVEKPKKKMLPRKGGLKMGEDERKGRGAAPFVLWFCFPREQRLGEDDWKWGLKVKRGGRPAFVSREQESSGRPCSL